MNSNKLLPHIVVIGYKKKSISRLLKSLMEAQYPEEGVSVTISLDFDWSQEVYMLCVDFKNKFSAGHVNITCQGERLGLKKHILLCGSLSNVYGSVIILEDDLYVDPYFYYYAVTSLDAYSKDPRVAGIALYSPIYNEFAGLPFSPLDDGTSTYFMQTACSWGQIWTSSQWDDFLTWYDLNKDRTLSNSFEIPESVRLWSQHSWKKYFSLYLATQKKFFVYPYRSYSTNLCSVGEHHSASTGALFQVPLALPCRAKEAFNYNSLDQSLVKYDSYMELIYDSRCIDLPIAEGDVVFDMYGLKPMVLLEQYQYVVTIKECSSVIEYYNLEFRPSFFFYRVAVGSGDSHILSLAKSTDIVGELSILNKRRILLINYLTNFDFTSKRFLGLYVKYSLPKVFRHFIKAWFSRIC